MDKSSFILSRCGFRCDLCMAYLPNIVAHPENAARLSDGWHTYFGFRIPPEKIQCPGCLAEVKQTLDGDCPVRPCALTKQVETCSQCNEYPCAQLKERLFSFESMQQSHRFPISPCDYWEFIFPFENNGRLSALASGGKICWLKYEGTAFLALAENSMVLLPETACLYGKNLADVLRSEAINLAQSRATEFLPDLPLLHLLAGKVALISFDRDNPAGTIYETDILYFQNYPNSSALVEDYRQFRTRLISDGKPV